MTSRAFSAILLRFAGLWFLFQALLAMVRVFYEHSIYMAGLAGIHRRWYEAPAQPLAFPDTYLHDAYYVVGGISPNVIDVSLKLIIGLTLLLASRPLARLLSRNVDTL